MAHECSQSLQIKWDSDGRRVSGKGEKRNAYTFLVGKHEEKNFRLFKIPT